MDFERIGKYQIVGKIGEGAMGQVYKAHDPILNRYVAIKTMLAAVGSDEELRKRFHREAQSAARLNHPNIITVFDFGEEQGIAYMAMELLDGSDLRKVIGNLTVTLEEKMSVMEQICDGLTFAHAMEIVHRDLKPANIHVQSNGQVKIMDFGLARLGASDMTRTGMVMGTPNYMSPEQVRGEKVDARSDIFSIGAVFYELLTVHKPFFADSTHAVLFQVLEKDPEPPHHWVPGLPEPLVAILDKALRKNPDERFADAGELLDAVREARESIPAETAMMALSPADRTSPTLAADAPQPEPSSGRGMSLARRSRYRSGATASDPRSRALPGPTQVPPPPTLLGRSPTRVEGQGTIVSPPPGRPAPSAATPARTPRGGGLATYAVGAVVLLVGGGGLGWYLTHRGDQTASNRTPPVPPPAAVALELAQRSLDAKDYSRALDQAEQALRLDPGSAEARRLMEAARAGLSPPTTQKREEVVPTSAPPTTRPAASPKGHPTAAPTAAPTIVPTTTLPATLPPPPPPPTTVTTTPPTTLAPTTTVPTTTLAPSPVVSDDTLIRRVVADYGRAIEEKDLALFKRIYPGLTAEAEKKLREAFGAGTQTVNITILDVQVAGGQATVHLSRRDTIDGQARSFNQTMKLARSGAGWVITGMGQ